MLRRLAPIVALLAAAPARAGDVVGAVRYAGAPPHASPLEVTKDRETCGTSQPDEALLVVGGRLANVVVSTGPVAGLPAAPSWGTLGQERCRFTPRVQVLPVGSTLEIVNGDPILHTATGQLGKARAFDVPTPTQGERVPKVLQRPGLVRVACDVHAWMRAFVWVLEGPAAVSGPDGAFRIAGLPAGSYTLTAWHETLGERTARVTVPPTGEARVEIVFE